MLVQTLTTSKQECRLQRQAIPAGSQINVTCSSLILYNLSILLAKILIIPIIFVFLQRELG